MASLPKEPTVESTEESTKETDDDASASNTGGESVARPSIAERPRIEVHDKDTICMYANFCRVTGTPEELILDFGLNSQPYGPVSEPVDVKQRLVVNYFTAKRMLQALQMSVQRHEATFGVLETDVQKRVLRR